MTRLPEEQAALSETGELPLPAPPGELPSAQSGRHERPAEVEVIRPPSFSIGDLCRHLARLAQHRDLLYTLTIHRIRVRYKQSVLGYFWAVLHPVLLLLLYTVIFARLAKVPTNGIPYAVFAYSALLPWAFFSNGLSAATIGLPAHSHLLSRVYFPREILPLSYVLAALMDFAIASVLLMALMFHYGFRLRLAVLWTIPAMLILSLFLTGVALFASALQTRFRDVGVAMPLLLQVWMFATPIVYSRASVPESFLRWYDLNPLVAITETFRAALVGGSFPDPARIVECVSISLVVTALSYAYFKHVEATLVDMI
jgi:lipopolysaccharide transport system permease protein